jgi:nucleoside-diphosphate-sugar epimerase
VGKYLMAQYTSITPGVGEAILIRAIKREEYLEPNAYLGCTAVIHLAGLAHRRGHQPRAHMAVNCDLAVASATAAAEAGVKRFIYVSSSKALADFAQDETALDEEFPPAPTCSYGRSKRAAEIGLLELHRQGIIEVVIARPALVIGSPAKANLRALARCASFSAKYPAMLPVFQFILSTSRAKKSLTSLGNLGSALVWMAQDGRAGGKIFHVVDDVPLSSQGLFLRLFNSANNSQTSKIQDQRNDSSWPKFAWTNQFLSLAFTLLGRSQSYSALTRPLVLDGRKIQRELEWCPETRIDAELQQIMMSLHQREEARK